MDRLTNIQGIPLKCFECEKENSCDQWCAAYDECAKKLKKYEDMHEKLKKRITEIKANENYPHNFMGQMVEDFEWVLRLLN